MKLSDAIGRSVPGPDKTKARQNNPGMPKGLMGDVGCEMFMVPSSLLAGASGVIIAVAAEVVSIREGAAALGVAPDAMEKAITQLMQDGVDFINEFRMHGKSFEDQMEGHLAAQSAMTPSQKAKLHEELKELMEDDPDTEERN